MFVSIIKARDDLHSLGSKLPNNMRIIDVPGEGHGFFRVLEKVLHQKADLLLRETVLNYMRPKCNDAQERLKLSLKQGDFYSTIFQDIAAALRINITLYKLYHNLVNLNSKESSDKSVNIAYITESMNAHYWSVETVQDESTIEEEADNMERVFQYILDNFDITITGDAV